MRAWGPLLAKELENLLKEMLVVARSGAVDPEGNFTVDVDKVNRLIAHSSETVTNYAKLARIGAQMLKGEATPAVQTYAHTLAAAKCTIVNMELPEYT